MSHAAVIGEEARIAGYGLAGVDVYGAEDAASVRASWDRLAADVAFVLFTPAAFKAVGERLAERPRLVWAVLPP